MATDIEQLIVSLEARTKTFENALNRSNSLAARNAKAIESRFAALNKNVSGQLDGLASIGVKAFALIGGAAGGKELIDSSIKISNALKVTGLSGQQLTDVYDKLFASAQQNNTPLETLVTLYSRASMASKELHASQSDLLNFSDKVALALRVQGSSAEESAGALLQLSQALGNGTVQAEEYNSLLDGGRSILQATAAGLKEAGGSVSELTKLVKSGKVSSEAFFRAFLAGAPVLAQQVASSETTISGSFVRLQNVLVDAAGKFNKSGEASKTFASFVDEAAATINAINFDALFGQIDKLYNKWVSLQNAIGNSGQNFGEATGLNNVGKWIAGALNGDQTAVDPGTGKLFYSTKAVADRINDAFSNANQSQDNAALTADAIRASLTGKTAVTANKAGPRLPADPNAGKKEDKIKPVTLADYPVTGQKKGGGGGGSSEDEYQRESRKIQEHTDLLKAQTDAQAKLNPLVKDFGYANDFAKTKQELLTSAKQADIKITPQVEADIEKLASGYATASAEADKLAATQDKVRERAEFLENAAYDAFSSLIPQIKTGNDALDKFLNTLIEAVAQSALLGKGPFASATASGGLLSFVPKLFGFANGGIAAHGKPLPHFAGGGVSRSASIFGEAGPEAAVPLPDGRRIPVDLRMPERTGSSGRTYAPVYHIDARGADQAAVDRLQRGLDQRDLTESKRVAAYNRTSQVRKVRP
ncbi:tape measure protein [Rhizobium sp. CNPSo 4062]|uniref:tape measure protein n=1 Tax=Rhizobium sp. CNPSo 4062 TaxID=3021410 RepID=UPI00254F2766|nr:tape measure protein [Rhizobium sp. CNPSo 4062]MDK4704332.1 tape measure protein [Rhizobium sp. CNPSo 4062]